MTNQDERARVRLGKTGPEVFPLGLGCMGMTDLYGASDQSEGLRTIAAAIERGIDLLDTGDFYGMGDNELLVGRAIAAHKGRVKVSVKFGALRGPDGSWLGMNGRPELVKAFAAYSLRRLGVEVIDVYRPARLDPAVPIEDTIGAITELIQAGYVRHVGLSEVGVETIRRAHAVHPIADLQIEYSIASRGPEQAIFPLLAELGIGATLYGVLSRGLLTGSQPRGAADFRAYLPRFSGEALEKNQALVDAFTRFAKSGDRTPAELAIAWVRAKQPRLLPLIGARTREQLAHAWRALERPLGADELAELERLIPKDAFAGERYRPEQMANLDSERA